MAPDGPSRGAAGFDPRAYWEQRLGERYTLDGVGWVGLGTAFNALVYRLRRRLFLRTVRRVLPRREEARVLDIGSGTGFYVDCWHALGVRAVAGADITDVAVTALRGKHPQDRFERFDVGGTELPFEPGSFDAISCMDVLFHIVDDARFARALENLAALLAPGGVLVFSDNFLHGPAIRTEHQVSRSLAEIESALSAAGLDVVERRPMFVLFNTPVDSQSRVLRAWWSLLSSVALRSNALGAALGALAYPLELLLVSTWRDGPSTELMVCRRASSSS
jgi:SAM-dependent methyltransferase